MTWLDIGLIVILAAFVVKGVMQGMLRQIVGLISVLAALLVAGRYSRWLAGWLVNLPALRVMALPAAYAILLLGVWSLLNLLGILVYRDVRQDEKDHWLDDLAGGVLGLFTGMFLLTALVLGAMSLGLAPARRAAESWVMRWVLEQATRAFNLPL